MREDPKLAELKAAGSMLRMLETLEEKKLRLKQQETRLNLEAVISKTVAKEEVLAAMVTPAPRSHQLRVKLEAWFNSEDDGRLSTLSLRLSAQRRSRNMMDNLAFAEGGRVVASSFRRNSKLVK